MIIQPNLSPVPHQNQYVLLDDHEIIYGDVKMLVPGYFLYDGASVPPIGWRLTYTPFHPIVMMPALGHDWPYLSHQISRKLADQMFYDHLILNGADPKRAKFMYWAVDKFGAAHWEWSKQDIKKLQLLYILIKKSPRFEEYHFPMEVLKAA